MKPTTHIVFASVCTCLILASCYTSKSITEKEVFPNQRTTVYKKCIVQFKDGSVREYQSLKLVTGLLKTPYLVADDKLKLETDNISSYSDGIHTAVAQEKFYNKMQGHVATKVLPGFAIKELSGNINLYSLQLYKNGNITKKYFLQYGEDGVITAYSPQILNEFLQLSGKVDNDLKKDITKIKARKLYTVIEQYNKNKGLSLM